jgi:NTP pyrophosphatase (non-canonical NTP hydrolase)
MDFKYYQAQAFTTAVYPDHGKGNWTYSALGLAGETGEICEKLKKVLRDGGGLINAEHLVAIRKELGDVLWYVAALCTELGLDMDQVATLNLEKLSARKSADRLHGEGDDR